MNAKPKDGGPAFPRPLGEALGTISDSYVGMSLRAWLAGMAMNGLLASNKEVMLQGKSQEANETTAAVAAVACADALISELEKEP